MEVRDTRLRSSLLKKNNLSHEFERFLEVKVLKKSAYIKACLFSTNNQSTRKSKKFQMFTLFCGRHIGVPRKCTNMAFLYKALYITAKYFDQYPKFGETHKPQA